MIVKWAVCPLESVVPSALQHPYRVVAHTKSVTIILTGPEHASLADEALLDAAMAEAQRVGLTVAREQLQIIWAPALGLTEWVGGLTG